jgi:hypothetical protein
VVVNPKQDSEGGQLQFSREIGPKGKLKTTLSIMEADIGIQVIFSPLA